MNIIKTIEDDLVEVEHFVANIVSDIAPITAIVEPQLTGWAKLAVGVLNAFADSTTDPLSQANINAHVNAIVANPAIAKEVLDKLGLSKFTDNATAVIKDVVAVGETVQNIANTASVVESSVVVPSALAQEVPASITPLTPPTYSGGGDI